jgi:hypothetical protein
MKIVKTEDGSILINGDGTLILSSTSPAIQANYNFFSDQKIKVVGFVVHSIVGNKWEATKAALRFIWLQKY